MHSNKREEMQFTPPPPYLYILFALIWAALILEVCGRRVFCRIVHKKKAVSSLHCTAHTLFSSVHLSWEIILKSTDGKKKQKPYKLWGVGMRYNVRQKRKSVEWKVLRLSGETLCSTRPQNHNIFTLYVWSWQYIVSFKHWSLFLNWSAAFMA